MSMNIKYLHRGTIFGTMAETGDDYNTSLAKLTAYFEPTSNTDIAIFELREMKQEHGDSQRLLLSVESKRNTL